MLDSCFFSYNLLYEKLIYGGKQMKSILKSILTMLIPALLFISCSASKTSVKDSAPVKKDKDTTVSGIVVTKDNEPIKDAYVYAYSSISRGQMGPADFISNPTNEKGEFSINVTSGEYYIIARKRTDESNVGVLDTGDYTSPTGFKITLNEGSCTKITLISDKIVEPMFFKKTGKEITDTGIKGYILDDKNNPVAGAFAIAYKDKAMKTLPDFASVPTQADGSYTLYLPDAGQYYIAARTSTKKPPVKGELYGRYDKTDDHSIVADSGSFLEDINITLKPFTGIAQTDFKGFK
jgi:hypothetical protein